MQKLKFSIVLKMSATDTIIVCKTKTKQNHNKNKNCTKNHERKSENKFHLLFTQEIIMQRRKQYIGLALCTPLSSVTQHQFLSQTPTSNHSIHLKIRIDGNNNELFSY